MASQPRRRPHIPLDCHACHVRDMGICAPFSDSELDLLQAFKSGSKTVDANQDFLHQSEPTDEFYILLDGWAAIYELLEDGRRQILDFSLPGALLGFQPDLESPLTYSAQALTDVGLCALSREALPEFVRSHPEMGLRMASVAARDQYLAFHHLSNVGRRTARERVASLLLELFYRVRLQTPEATGDSVPLPLTQEHIGDALGLTPVHVNRMLRGLREDGVVALRGGTLHVLDPDRLAEVAGFDTRVDFPHLP